MSYPLEYRLHSLDHTGFINFPNKDFEVRNILVACPYNFIIECITDDNWAEPFHILGAKANRWVRERDLCFGVFWFYRGFAVCISDHVLAVQFRLEFAP